MSDDPRVQQLLDELCDSHATPEDVCGSCPELLPVVRERWRQLRRVEAEVDALFPGPPEPGAGGPPSAHDATALPRVPGYEVEAVLGRGGMGVVYRARQLRLNRVVALKMALAGAAAGPPERERFRYRVRIPRGSSLPEPHAAPSGTGVRQFAAVLATIIVLAAAGLAGPSLVRVSGRLVQYVDAQFSPPLPPAVPDRTAAHVAFPTAPSVPNGPY